MRCGDGDTSVVKFQIEFQIIRKNIISPNNIFHILKFQQIQMNMKLNYLNQIEFQIIGKKVLIIFFLVVVWIGDFNFLITCKDVH